MSLRMKFWGVRGSIACSSPDCVVYGGNTSCVEVEAGGHHIILDAGTGIRDLGRHFMRAGVTHAVLLMSHTHWDHISGFPFFAPAFVPGNAFHVMAGHLTMDRGVQHILESQMTNPMFPVPMAAMKSHLTFTDFLAGDSFTLFDEIAVRTARLNHPNDATAYRLDYGGVSVCYVTDTEHVPGHPDRNVLSLIEGADLVIYDATYDEAEFPSKLGWGHSTWEEGVRLCRAAGARRLAIFHHAPEHDDAFMANLEAEAHAAWSGTFAARDN
ncbi:MAG: MBL fold metallo-hydrolase, partial [Alphaproteobacteria bacterium]|nr:MBL fold metallo-hydrolase [Alphaproteobacteria bacterium]